MSEFATIEQALEDLRDGKIIVCTDDPDRENEGDFICAAEFATPENVNFMACYGKRADLYADEQPDDPEAGAFPDGCQQYRQPRHCLYRIHRPCGYDDRNFRSRTILYSYEMCGRRRAAL